MKKNIVSVLGILGGGICAVSAFFILVPQEISQEELLSEKTHTGSTEVSHVSDTNTTPEVSREEIVQERIENIKKRLALKGLIIEGDNYFQNDQLALALKKYLEFYRENPEDTLILEKIASTYFAMHKYKSALNYYSKISLPREQIREQILLTHLYAADLDNPEDREKIKNTLQQLDISDEMKFYYLTSLDCVTDFHACKLRFQEYFWPQEAPNAQADATNPILSYEKLIHIQEAIQNYRNFQLDDVTLKNAYIIGAWYQDGLYPLVIHMGEKLLLDRPGYKSVIKMIAQSHYFLGNYDTARQVFSRFYEDDDSDAGVAYMLGVIHSEMREYVLANIYLTKALELGYENSLQARRYIISNLETLGNYKRLLKEFKSLVNTQENITQADLRVAIYFHILYEEYQTALDWSHTGQKLFPESADFFTYEAWILREQGNNTAAKEVLLEAQLIDPENPFMLINLAYTYIALEEKSAGVVTLKKILRDFPNGEFTQQAQTALNQLNSQTNSDT